MHRLRTSLAGDVRDASAVSVLDETRGVRYPSSDNEWVMILRPCVREAGRPASEGGRDEVLPWLEASMESAGSGACSSGKSTAC